MIEFTNKLPKNKYQLCDKDIKIFLYGSDNTISLDYKGERILLSWERNGQVILRCSSIEHILSTIENPSAAMLEYGMIETLGLCIGLVQVDRYSGDLHKRIESFAHNGLQPYGYLDKFDTKAMEEFIIGLTEEFSNAEREVQNLHDLGWVWQ